MVDLQSLMQLQAELFLLMGAGYFLRKKNILPAQGRKILTDLVIDLILPANIINSFLMKMNAELLRQGIAILILSIAIQILCQVLGRVLYPRAEKNQKPVLEYATICSNAGFMGNPLVEEIYGATGLMYASIYLIPQRIVMWSAGVACFTVAKGREVVKKVLTHPCIVACIVGVILLLTQVQLPDFLLKTIKACSGCNTALSMLVIGGILAEIPIASVVNRLTVYYCFIRLLGLPLLVLGACVALHVPPLVTSVGVVLAGMPAGTTTAMLAEKYNGDAQLAVRLIFLSTVGSLITIPVLCLLSQALTG